jgi:hypothetical protein
MRNETMLAYDARFPYRRLALVTMTVLSAANCLAEEPPVVGVLEYTPIMNDGPKALARPTYIFTDQKVYAPTVFSAFVSAGNTLAVACCFEVTITKPTSLDAELSKYGQDSWFVERMKSIKCYRYIYMAQPTTDQLHWTPLMKTIASNTNADDATPFSSPVVAAQFDRPIISTSFKSNVVPVTLQFHVNRTADRIVNTFTRSSDKLEFSESGFTD